MSHPVEVINTWGVHRGPDGLLWLLQRRGVSNAWGVDAPCPFQVKSAAICPHDLDTSVRSPSPVALTAFDNLQKRDPLLSFLTNQSGGRGRLPDTPLIRVLIRLYLRLFGSDLVCVLPVDVVTRSEAKQLLHQTNFAPLVLTGCTVRFFDTARRAWEIAESSPRKLLLLGDRNLPLPGLIPRADPEPHEVEEASTLPWEFLGAHRFRNMT